MTEQSLALAESVETGVIRRERQDVLQTGLAVSFEISEGGALPRCAEF